MLLTRALLASVFD